MMSLNHPFILKLHNTYSDSKMLYFLVELCQGGEMFSHLRRNSNYSEKDAKFWAASIVLCLSEMRNKNIAYRDLKPGRKYWNVMYKPYDLFSILWSSVENIMFDSTGYLKVKKHCIINNLLQQN